MTPRKDVANNIEQAAQDLMVYMLTYRDEIEKNKLQIELDNILEQAEKDYAGVEMSYFNQYFVYPFSRKRYEDVKQAKESLHKCSEEQFGRFVIFVDLLKHGECYHDSLNTSLLNKLIAATGKYNPIDEEELDHAESDNVTTRKRFKHIFRQKALALIEQKKAEKEQEEKIAQQRATVRDEAGEAVHRLNKENYKEIMTKLNDYLKKEAAKKQEEVVKSAETKEKIADVKKVEEPVDALKRAVSAPLDLKNVKIKKTDKFPKQQAMLLEAFERQKAKEEQKAAEKLKPLFVTHGEMVAFLQSENKLIKASAPIPIPPRRPGKLMDDLAFAEARASIGGFFVKKLEAEKPKKPGFVKEKFAEAYAAVAKKFNAKL